MKTLEALKDFGPSCSRKEQDRQQDKPALAVGMGGIHQNEGDEQPGKPAGVAESSSINLKSILDSTLPRMNKPLARTENELLAEAEGCRILEAAQPEYAVGPQLCPDLHGFRPSKQVIQQEKYEHRIVAELKAAGKSNQEICAITGFVPSTVSYIVKTPWCKQYILVNITRNGGAAVLKFMETKAMVAAEVIVEAITSDEMEARRDRAAAANSLLDRVFGKANQNIVTHKGADIGKLSDEELVGIAQS